jgi:large subunit ribosomal protein L35
MPKMKTHSGAKKRFKVTGTGKVRGRHPFTSHILEKKSPKKKRALGGPKIMNAHDVPRIKRMLGVPKGTGTVTRSVKTAGRSSIGRKSAGGDS